MVNNLTDTIAAISTPIGTGGVGVIRISGESALNLVEKIFKCKVQDFEPNRVYHGWVHDNNKLVDEAIMLYFRAPNSFTGEDVCEIQCHGGITVVKKILKLCLASGARFAENGEFSKRAFVNRKMDLSKAEAVLDLIHAKTDKFSEESVLNLSGKLAQKISILRQELVNLLSIVTAAVDFPEEVDEPEYSYISTTAESIIASIDEILRGSVSSNLMRDGVKVALVGKPNAGKSSLFNALLDMDRAIVTDIPGTTRDVIQESIDIDGIPVTLLDTAGLRESNDHIESIGINLTQNVIKTADIVLCLYDLTEEKVDNEQITGGKKVIKVGTKVDLLSNKSPELDDFILISSIKRRGLDDLKQAISSAILANGDSNGEFCTNLRQQECLQICKSSLIKVTEACKLQEPQDLISIDIKAALIALGEITGEVVSEEILDNIFSNFCIGK